MAVKDWIDVAGWPVAGAEISGGVPGRRPGRDAPAVARLRAAGAVVVAITAALADNAVHGETRHPHGPGRAPGGSSSGAAAVVTTGAPAVALPLAAGARFGPGAQVVARPWHDHVALAAAGVVEAAVTGR